MNQIKLDKMRELEFKDIACYVPYKPKCHVMGGCDDDGNAIVYTVTGCDNDRNGNWVFVSDDGVENCEAVEDVFLLLHPMSDLTKEMTIKGYNNGESFVPEKVINMSFNTIYNEIEIIDLNCVVSSNSYLTMFDMYGILDLLNQWHFDYRNLIGQGLAIDINTLNK